MISRDSFGDLQDIVAINSILAIKRRILTVLRNFLLCPVLILKLKVYDLSLSRYKENVFENVEYDKPSIILDRLLQAEVGNIAKVDLAKRQSGNVRELLELRGMIE